MDRRGTRWIVVALGIALALGAVFVFRARAVHRPPREHVSPVTVAWNEPDAPADVVEARREPVAVESAPSPHEAPLAGDVELPVHVSDPAGHSVAGVRVVLRASDGSSRRELARRDTDASG